MTARGYSSWSVQGLVSLDKYESCSVCLMEFIPCLDCPGRDWSMKFQVQTVGRFRTGGDKLIVLLSS